MTSSNEEKIQKGMAATAVKTALQDTLYEQEQAIIHRMKSMYRSQELDPNRMISQVAQLCAIEDIRTALESQERQGYIAANKEFGDG